ncbi:MAG: 2-oxo acid dehydrogenase subunit E2 [Planctomycetes bacterium]|nr:2-oxo acid dehydrogenase subunit E2 [Planctomycetota bacterium]
MSSIEFKLPDIGEGVHEGEIVRWIVPVGGTVSEDDPVVEVMTDKATVEIPSPASGTITQHMFEEGDVANVGDVIFLIGAGGGAAAPAAPAEAAPAAVAPAPAAPTPPPVAPAPVAAAPSAAPAASGGELEFKLPDIGEGVHEGEIVRWIVPEGGEVAEDDPVVEVMTDKATVEIPSPAAGSISRHMVTEGEIANVGDVIFVIALVGSAGGAAPSAPAAPVAAPAAPSGGGGVAPVAANGAPQGSATATLAPANPNKKVLAAPATRRLARELNVDLTVVMGSGPDGRVKPEDVRAAAAAPVAAPAPIAAPAPVAAPVAAPIAAPAGTGGTAVTPADSGAAVTPIPAFPAVMGTREFDSVPFRGIRRKTAEAMSRSKFTAAHFSLIEEVDCTEMVDARSHAKATGAKYGVKITYMPYIMKATAIALQEFPQLNAELDVEANVIKVKKYVNLGIAVDTPNGLVVPVVKDVNLKGLLQLSADLTDIANRARTGKLKPDDFKDSTFTLSNAGNIGGVFATPIINFPEVAIMGIHAMRKMPRCVGDDIVARQVMMLSISIDHRLVDGADGARFMVRVRELLENPGLMLL